jgi:hypothetical protein
MSFVDFQPAEAVVHVSYPVGSKMSVKNLEQWINIKLCVKIGKCACEISALLTMAYGELPRRNPMFLNSASSSDRVMGICSVEET